MALRLFQPSAEAGHGEISSFVGLATISEVSSHDLSRLGAACNLLHLCSATPSPPSLRRLADPRADNGPPTLRRPRESTPHAPGDQEARDSTTTRARVLFMRRETLPLIPGLKPLGLDRQNPCTRHLLHDLEPQSTTFWLSGDLTLLTTPAPCGIHFTTRHHHVRLSTVNRKAK